jgi:hypothetical protein
MSTRIPSLFISLTSSLPKDLPHVITVSEVGLSTHESPPQASSGVSKIPAESANALLHECVRVMYLTPRRWKVRSTGEGFSCVLFNLASKLTAQGVSERVSTTTD